MKFIFLYVFLLFVILSCKKEVGVQGPAGGQGNTGLPGSGGPSDTGTIIGNTVLYNEFSFKETDHSGTIVTLISGNFQQNDTTDLEGNYQFHGIKTDTYDMTFQKSGFGVMKIYGLTHIAGGNVPTKVKDIYLLQMPEKTAVDSLALLANTSSIVFTVFLDTSSTTYVQNYSNFLLYIGKDKDVGMTHYSINWGSGTFNPDGNGGYTAFIDKASLSNVFQPGDSLYIKVYSFNGAVHSTNSATANYYISTGDGGSYIDPATGFYIYPNASAAPKLLVVPF